MSLEPVTALSLLNDDTINASGRLPIQDLITCVDKASLDDLRQIVQAALSKIEALGTRISHLRQTAEGLGLVEIVELEETGELNRGWRNTRAQEAETKLREAQEALDTVTCAVPALWKNAPDEQVVSLGHWGPHGDFYADVRFTVGDFRRMRKLALQEKDIAGDL